MKKLKQAIPNGKVTENTLYFEDLSEHSIVII